MRSHRARDADVAYLRNVFPLLARGWTRAVESACLGCPFHGNTGWKWVPDNDPDGWADAVEFDRQIRHGYPHATARGQHLRGT